MLNKWVWMKWENEMGKAARSSLERVQREKGLVIKCDETIKLNFESKINKKLWKTGFIPLKRVSDS